MRISIEDKLFLTRHLSTMIKAGVSLDDALETVADQASPDLAKLLKKVKTDIDNGTSLGDSFAKYPKIFDRFFVSLIRAGEVSGTLEENLSFLAEQMGKNYALKRKVQGALIYPILVLSATFVMGIGISWFVLPQLIDMFSSFEITLPLSTRILMWVAYFMRDYGVIVVPGMVGLIFLFLLFLRVKKIKMIWDTWVLSIPFIGKVISFGEMGKFSRNLGTLLKSGLPVTDAFTVTINTLSNMKFIADLKLVQKEVETGKTVAAAMTNKKYPEFGKLAIRMIGVGEKSGNLEEMLSYLAVYYDEEIDNVSKNLTTLLEPVLLLVIGLVVGFVAMAIISPIYTMVGSVGG